MELRRAYYAGPRSIVGIEPGAAVAAGGVFALGIMINIVIIAGGVFLAMKLLR